MVYLVSIIFSVVSLVLSQPQIDEQIVKAVFLERITPFVIWPEECDMENSTKDFIIGTWDDESFYTKLKEVYFDKKILSKDVYIKNITRLKEIDDCNILYIPKIENSKLLRIIKYTHGSPILLISDTPGYAKKGVHINLFIENQNLGFEINEEAVKDANIHISHLLLELAKIVKSGSKY
ncbi:MAG: YfiR family protein [Ignavibacteriaceae bacterium]|nr:YfiR family protein [Ignavibacteriaceae bacterium]